MRCGKEEEPKSIVSLARSKNMSAIRARNTTPEHLVRTELFKRGIRFRLHSKVFFGKPDLLNLKRGFAVFVDGCFWHRHQNCPFASKPKTNQLFWANKFVANVERDRIAIEQLLSANIRVAIVKECSLKKRESQLTTISRLVDWVEQGVSLIEFSGRGYYRG